LILITGGARSGKSRHAQELALQYSERPIYVATARAWDDELKQRIRIHQQDRDERWRSIEEQRHLSRLSLEGEVAVIDCVTLWITNFFSDFHGDVNACLDACRREIDELARQNALLIIVTNELGMGLHADTEAGRKFTDLQGWINQHIAGMADEVVFMVSGIPVKIKGVPGVATVPGDPPAMPSPGRVDDYTHKTK
jgi:adenosylcobinamide kinase / adenosylcobinamide-phosphate guanylyltransferase